MFFNPVESLSFIHNVFSYPFYVSSRKKRTDMFSFLASRHRKLSQVPLDNADDPDIAQEIAFR